jgi:hypothetical protein
MKALDEAVRFAGMCKANEFEPREFADLIRLTRRAVAAGERACSVPNTQKAADRAMERVEVHAAKMGLRTDWPGLFPTFLGRSRVDSLPFMD